MIDSTVLEAVGQFILIVFGLVFFVLLGVSLWEMIVEDIRR